MVIKVILFVSLSVCVCLCALAKKWWGAVDVTVILILLIVHCCCCCFVRLSIVFHIFQYAHRDTQGMVLSSPFILYYIQRHHRILFFRCLSLIRISTRRMLRMYDSRFNIHSLIRESFQYTRLRFTCVDVTVSMCACVSARVCVYKKQPNHWQHTVKCRWIEASKKYAYTIFKG